MSHEFRTPMNGIIGMTSILLDTSLTPQQREYAEIVRDSANELLGIINEILDFSHIEAGKLTLTETDFELSPIIESAADLLAPVAHTRRVSLMTFISPDIPERLRGDPARLRQVLVYLLENAIRFTEQGEVVLRAILERETATHITVKFLVRDTGTGLSEAARRNVFQPFAQSDNPSIRLHNNTGLGLAIAQRLVKLMGGRIDVESMKGHGAIFWFSARFERPSALLLTPAPRRPSHNVNVRVLIASNDHHTRDLLSNYILNWHMHGNMVSNGTELLNNLHDEQEQCVYDVIILDQDLPDMDGLSLIRTIKQEERAAAPGVILLIDSRNEQEQGQQALRLGASAYLTRPVKQAEVFDAIAETLADDTQLLLPPEVEVEEIAEVPTLDREQQRPILLAEDNPVSERIALRQLEKLGYTVHSVNTGREVLSALSQSATGYGMILMDCQMPDMDGFEATQAIRETELRTGQHIPIIAMTANAMPDDRDICLAIGMDDYICKPVSLDTMRDVIERWMISSQTE